MDSATKYSKASEGFTLVEVMISLTLASLLLAAVLGSNIAMLKSQNLSAAYIGMSVESRKALELMADDVRQMKSITIENAGFSGLVPAKTGTGNVTLRWQFDSVLGQVSRTVDTVKTVVWKRVSACELTYYGAGSLDTTLTPARMNRGQALTVGSSTKVKQVQMKLTTRATVMKVQASQQSISAQFTARP